MDDIEKTVVDIGQWPLSQTWINFNPSMDK